MRLLLRLLMRAATFVFVALGIKALYDRFWPKAKELRQPAVEVLGTAKSAARDVTEPAKAAAGEVAAEARARVDEA
jgi:hypothetical protein